MTNAVNMDHHRTVAVIAFESITSFHLSVPSLVFGSTTGDAWTPPFEVVVCATKTGPLQTSAGFAISAEHDLGRLNEPTLL
jgi:transcriptional regulator GlxA family with amidase domain